MTGLMALDVFAQSIVDTFLFGRQNKENHKCNWPKDGKRQRAPYGTWKCKWCDFIGETKNELLKHNHNVHFSNGKSHPSWNKASYPCTEQLSSAGKSHPAWNKGLTDETSEIVANAHKKLHERYASRELVSSWKGKHWSEEEKKKISETRKKYLQEHPDKVPYLLNHSSKMSYPEQYFMELFQQESIPLSFHKQVGIYQLDFYNEELKKYIEIDR